MAVDSWELVGQDAAGQFCLVKIPNRPLAQDFRKIFSDPNGCSDTYTFTHLTISQRLTNTQWVKDILWIISGKITNLIIIHCKDVSKFENRVFICKKITYVTQPIRMAPAISNYWFTWTFKHNFCWAYGATLQTYSIKIYAWFIYFSGILDCFPC